MPKRLLHIFALCVFAFTMLGAGTPATSFDKVGQILLECNHVNCPVSGPMINELRAQMATSLPETAVLSWFASKYGPIVLAAPIRGGFDNVAWIVPFAVLLLGTAGVATLIHLWKRRHTALAPAIPDSSQPKFSEALRDRIRHDTNLS